MSESPSTLGSSPVTVLPRGGTNAGPGTAVAQSKLYLKQLFLELKPADGIEVQYGGIEFARGESSEITSYDYDGYLVGGRILIRRPTATFFDEVAVTYGNVGDLGRPNVFRRLKRLGRSNYSQFLVTKRAGRRLRLSADYTSDSGADTLRQAITIRVPEIRMADSLHFEQYEHTGRQAGYGFSAYGERKLARRFSLGGGYAQLDRLGLYSDRFNIGRRIFWNSHIALGPEWSRDGAGDVRDCRVTRDGASNPVRPDRGVQRSASPALRRTPLRDQPDSRDDLRKARISLQSST